MGCLFCNSNFHFTEDCDEYETDEARKGNPNSDRFCFSCRTVSSIAHLPEDKECKSNENCIGWFSIEHHKLFCAERIKAFKAFIPKIDQNILPRFLEMFDMDEKYSIVLSSPTTKNIVQLKPIKIRDYLNDKFFKSNVIVGSAILYNTNMKKSKNLFDSINSNIAFCFPRTVFIRESILTSEAVLQLLSLSTKNFTMFEASCNPNLSISDIIKKAPNLESIYVTHPEKNIEIGKTWLEDLLKYKSGKKFDYLSITVDDVKKLNVEMMVKFIETKCSKTARIKIYFCRHLSDKDEHKELYNETVKQLSKYFDPMNEKETFNNDKGTWIQIGFELSGLYHYFSLEKFKQSAKIMPI